MKIFEFLILVSKPGFVFNKGVVMSIFNIPDMKDMKECEPESRPSGNAFNIFRNSICIGISQPCCFDCKIPD